MSSGLLWDRWGLQLPLHPWGCVWWAEQKPSGFGELLLASEESSETGLPHKVVFLLFGVVPSTQPCSLSCLQVSPFGSLRRLSAFGANSLAASGL